MATFHRVLKNSFLLLILCGTNTFANEEKIMDAAVCLSVKRGKPIDLEADLKERFNLSIEESYLDIWCGDTDLMGTVIESPHERYALVKYIRRHFTKMGKPEKFSELLLSEVEGITVLRIIQATVETIEEHADLKSGEMHTRLLKMQQKYIKWLITYPVSGSAMVANEHRKYLTTND